MHAHVRIGLAVALALLVACSALADRVTPARLRLDDGTDSTQVAVFSMAGYSHGTIQCSAPGVGTDFTYALTSRVCSSSTSCSGWEATNLAAGTVSGTDTLELVLAHPRDELRLTLTNGTGDPEIACFLYLGG